jgi:hypothetical protein
LGEQLALEYDNPRCLKWAVDNQKAEIAPGLGVGEFWYFTIRILERRAPVVRHASVSALEAIPLKFEPGH